MSNYALVKNGQIIERHDSLPASWGNISGLHLAKDNEEFLNSLGWYTIQKNLVDHDPETQFVSDNTYTFKNNVVTETPVFKQKEVILSVDPKTEFFDQLRAQRDLLLNKSDWTQIPEVQISRNANWIADWAVYRKQLRDLPDQYENNVININDVVWPSIPNKNVNITSSLVI